MSLRNLPEDFDAFWAETVAEAMKAPLRIRRALGNAYDCPNHIVETLTFQGIDGVDRHGWIAYPEGQKRCPAFLWLPPYGRESKLPDAYGTREGMTSMSFNLHGESAFHQEKYQISRGYFAHGAEDPMTWIGRTNLQNSILAARVLQAQVEVDEDRIGVAGMSQGGGMSIWLGAHCPIVKAVCADMPFLANIGQTLSGSVFRYPLKELVDFMETIPIGRERVLNTLAYFDTANVATRCRIPTQVSLGERDPACRPETVEAVFEALAGSKRLIRYPGGHDWDPKMVENNLTWLTENLR